MDKMHYLGKLVLSAYCSCHLCCGKQGGTVTASRTKPLECITVAASRNIPFGTWLWIENIGWRRVEDRLSKRYDSRVDVYMNSHKKAKQFGLRKEHVYAVKK